MKAKLKKRALEAQKAVHRALELGEADKVKQLQDMNIKVFSLLDLKMSEITIPKLNVPSAKENYRSNTFALTSNEPDEEQDKPVDPYKNLGLSASKHQQQNSNRFETPATEQKKDDPPTIQISVQKPALIKSTAPKNNFNKPSFMMNKKIAEMPKRD